MNEVIFRLFKLCFFVHWFFCGSWPLIFQIHFLFFFKIEGCRTLQRESELENGQSMEHVM